MFIDEIPNHLLHVYIFRTHSLVQVHLFHYWQCFSKVGCLSHHQEGVGMITVGGSPNHFIKKISPTNRVLKTITGCIFYFPLTAMLKFLMMSANLLWMILPGLLCMT